MDEFRDSAEALKKAKDAYQRARVRPFPPAHCSDLIVSLFYLLQLPYDMEKSTKLCAAAKALRKAGLQVGDVMSAVLNSMEAWI